MMRNEFLIAVGVILLLLLAAPLIVKVEPPTLEEKILYKEEVLLKNRNFSIAPDARLIYRILNTDGSTLQNISFAAAKGANCIWLYAEGSMPTSCIGSEGTDESGSNITLNDKELFFFKPWMLALDDDFRWSVQGCFVINNESVCDLNLSIKVIRVDYVGSKKHYVVRYSYGPFEVYQWIEDERRIIAREVGQGYEITLIE